MADHPPITRMMSESEDPKVSDAATPEEKCELGIDHKNSYVDTNGADGLNDEVVVNENAVAVGSSGLPEFNTMVDDQVQEQGAQNEKLDAVNGEEENGNVVWDDEFPPLGSSVEHAHGFRVCFAKSLEEHNTGTKSWLDVVKKPHDRVVMKEKPEFRNFSGSSSRAITSDVSTTRRIEVSDSFDVKNDDASIVLSETVEALGPHQEPKQETIEENVSNDGMLEKKTKTHKNQTVASKGSTEPAHRNDLVVVSEPKKSAKEDVELTRKTEEELRSKATEAKLKEQPQLEELAKANEARERKKRQAEKAQMRAELRAEKEAEQKEKEREKRLRRKERKKATARDVHDTENNCDGSLEISNDVEDKNMLPLMPKGPQKPRLSTKQSKTKSFAPPLRNRNRKMYRHWMWVGLICIVIFALLWFRSAGLFSNVKLNRQNLI